MLRIEGLSSGYGETPILRDVTMHVHPGETIALMGRNGVGKTTLLKSIMGLLPARSGRIWFAGQDITTWTPDRRARLGLGYVPQGRDIFPYLTVEENLRLGAYTRRDRHAVGADFERVYAYLPVLAERRAQQAGTLSGGEQQMLAIARALMLRPRLLVLDEPSFGLAPMLVEAIFEIMRTINASEGVSMLLVEQNAAIALELADHAYLLETGRVVLSGRSEVLRSDASVRRVYLGY